VPPLLMGISAFAFPWPADAVARLQVTPAETMPLLGVPALVAYPDMLPFRIVAAGAGLILLPVVSRATARWDAAQPLRNVAAEAA
jgi:hypothetical protein